eukprot:7366599-Pyramimonas_sp.AAC.1
MEASKAVLGRYLGPLGLFWSVGKPKTWQSEKPSTTQRKPIHVDTWGSLGGPLGSPPRRPGGPLAVWARCWGPPGGRVGPPG